MTEERKKPENRADPQINKILDLEVKDFKISMINIFKKIMGKNRHIRGKDECYQKTKIHKNKWNEHYTNEKISEMKNSIDGFNNSRLNMIEARAGKLADR